MDPAFVFLPLAAVILFGGSIRMGFLQDDFHQLTRAFTPWTIDWPEAFSLRAGYYRPITQRLLPAIEVWLFGKNPAGYHILALALFAANACLLYRVIRGFVVGRLHALLGAMFYITRSALFLKLYWISAASEAWMLLFFLLSILLFSRAIRSTGVRRSALLGGSIVLYLLALLSKETVLFVPVLLFVLAGYFAKAEPSENYGAGARSPFAWRRAVASTSFHWILLGIYLALRVGVGAMGEHGLYLFSQPGRIVVNGLAYVAMTLDFNRELLRQVFLREWPPVLPWLLPWAVVFVALWIVLPLGLIRVVRTRRARSGENAGGGTWLDHWRSRRGAVAVSIVWMAVGAIPLAGLTLAFYGYYLNLFLGGLALFVALLAEYLGGRLTAVGGKPLARRAATALLIAAFLLSFFSVRLQESLPHTNFRRAEEVRIALSRLQADLPSLPANSVALLTGLTRKQYWAFGWGYCLQWIYGGSGYRIYSEFEEQNAPERIPGGPYLELHWADGRFQLLHKLKQPGIPPAGPSKSPITPPMRDEP